MQYPRYAYIPQCVFPNQRDIEKIFVLTRRHIISFVFYIFIFALLAIIPIFFAFLLMAEVSKISLEVNLLTADALVVLACAYYLLIISFFITSWVSYYYDIFIVTDERIIDITQKGLFSREIYELSFEQIEDVTTKTKGFLNTIFEAGDIEIQTAAQQRNFTMKRVPKPHIVAEIIHSLTLQARNKKQIERRTTEMAAVGLIERTPVVKGSFIPPIMNFDGKLSEARAQYRAHASPPTSLRQYFDKWWWSHMRADEGLFTNYDYIKRYQKKTNKKSKEKS